MRERCWRCNKWEEHFYWDHFEESKFHFMKVMDGDFTQKMEFPQKFVKNFRVELIDVVELEAPSGKSWEIGLCKEQDHFYFNGGWKTFIEANEIKEEYILVFQYAGNSKFMVRIFDKTGCVRATSNLPDKGQTKQKIVNQTSKNKRNSYSSGSSCNHYPSLHTQATDNESSSIRELIRDEEHGTSKVKDDGRVRCSRSSKKKLYELQPCSNSAAKINVRKPIDTIKILELKFASKEVNCSFVKLISKCNFNKWPFMTIPTKIWKKHIPQNPCVITVTDENKRNWHVNCSWRRSCWGFTGKSLYTLLQENKLENGDACLFKLRENDKKVVMVMSVVKAKEICSILKNCCT